MRAVIANQELDSRPSTGAVYREGLSERMDSNGKRVGRGDLEMTEHAAALGLCWPPVSHAVGACLHHGGTLHPRIGRSTGNSTAFSFGSNWGPCHL